MITAQSLEQAENNYHQENLPITGADLLNFMRMLGMDRLKDVVTEPHRIIRDTGQSEHMS